MIFIHMEIFGSYRTGNELTPYSKYAFKFKDYAPWVFRHLREYFSIDAADYLVSGTILLKRRKLR
jgi:hypothetical protein